MFAENASNAAREQQGLDIGLKEPDDVPLLDAIPQSPGGGGGDVTSLLSGLSGNELVTLAPSHHQGQGDTQGYGGQGYTQGHAQGHFRSASGGSLRDIIEGSPLISLNASPTQIDLLSDPITQNMPQNNPLAQSNHPLGQGHQGHQRSPSDTSLRQLQLSGAGTMSPSLPPPAPSHLPRTHRRTPSDISLRTLASIRGTYHKRTASDVSLPPPQPPPPPTSSVAGAGRGHARSPSNGSMGSPVHDPLLAGQGQGHAQGQGQGHQRTGSTGSSSAGSVLLDAGGDDYQASHIPDDISLLSAGKERICV